tara:strand:- start:1130 stop:2209 length:1080 start_codon:yes stop_codon:yes gene_type:complete
MVAAGWLCEGCNFSDIITQFEKSRTIPAHHHSLTCECHTCGTFHKKGAGPSIDRYQEMTHQVARSGHGRAVSTRADSGPKAEPVDFQLRVISLGAGVQSSTMALMSAVGYIEPCDYALFSDTGNEPAEVYEWLDWLENELPFEVVRVSAGNLADDSLRLRQHQTKHGVYAKNMIPAYVLQPDGSKGLLGRRCTGDYKVIPIQREIKLRLGGRKRGKRMAESWLGISTDEAHRMKPSREKSIVNRWPLIEKGISRQDCLVWMRAKGYPQPPRSACYFCPFHSDKEWIRLATEAPDDFRRAVVFEKKLQVACASTTIETAKLRGVPFLHRACIPLSEVEFGNSGQLDFSGFGNDCEGLCGV